MSVFKRAWRRMDQVALIVSLWTLLASLLWSAVLVFACARWLVRAGGIAS